MPGVRRCGLVVRRARGGARPCGRRRTARDLILERAGLSRCGSTPWIASCSTSSPARSARDRSPGTRTCSSWSAAPTGSRIPCATASPCMLEERGAQARLGRPAARGLGVGFHVVIPARYASTRLPGKPLLDIGGRTDDPAGRRAAPARAAPTEVLVATDDARIAAAVHDPRRPAGHRRDDRPAACRPAPIASPPSPRRAAGATTRWS